MHDLKPVAYHFPMLPPARLLLASASPRRRELLAAAGFSFEVRHVDVDEQPRAGEAPPDYVRRLAAEKSARALETVGAAAGGDLVVIGADTTVVVDGQILGKPEDDREARRMLARLSGRTHLVLTGLSLRNARHDVESVEETTVWFAPLSEADVAWYVASGEWRDKAGGYAIQGLAARFIPRIEGSYSNVVGLPVAAVVDLLARLDRDPYAVASRG
jgi:septum formation protein